MSQKKDFDPALYVERPKTHPAAVNPTAGKKLQPSSDKPAGRDEPEPSSDKPAGRLDQP